MLDFKGGINGWCILIYYLLILMVVFCDQSIELFLICEEISV